LKKEENRRSIVSAYGTAAIRLLTLTGCRLREILDLKWQHVDMERGLLNLPDSKTGATTIVLAAPALEVLANVPRTEGCPYVIAGEALDQQLSDLSGYRRSLARRGGGEGVADVPSRR
jgi:integrase